MTAMRLKRYPSAGGGIALGKMGAGATLMRSSPLPPGARWVEYLESTGTQWIDTGFKLRSTDTIDTRFYINSSATANWYGILGARDAEKFLTLRCYEGNDGILTIPGNIFTFSRFTWGNLTFSFGGSYHESSENCYLFTYNNNGSPYSRLPYKLANFSVIRDSSKILDFIPVRRGTVGYMYDRVSGKLFGNAGTGDFVIGPDINTPAI